MATTGGPHNGVWTGTQAQANAIVSERKTIASSTAGTTYQWNDPFGTAIPGHTHTIPGNSYPNPGHQHWPTNASFPTVFEIEPETKPEIEDKIAELKEKLNALEEKLETLDREERGQVRRECVECGEDRYHNADDYICVECRG